MATVKIKFRKSSVEGKAGTLYYQLCHKQNSKQITTRMYVFPRWWDAENEALVVDDDNREIASAYQRQIENDLSRIRRILCEWDGEGKEYTLAEVVARFREQEVSPQWVLAGLEEWIGELEAANRWGSARNLRRTLNSFSRFLERDVSFEQLDRQLVGKYEQWLLAQGVSKNSCSFYMRNLRSFYNTAVARGGVEQRFPFRNVYTGVERTRKRAVDEEVLVRLQKLNLEKSASLAFARDLFIFSYCTRGMSFVDMAYLRKENVDRGVIGYARHKTGQRLSIRIEPCAEVIIRRYEPLARNTPYLFPILTSDKPEEAFRQYQTALGYFNRRLKAVGKMVDCKLSLSSYMARHSWATIARNHNVPLFVISAGMGHTSEKTTLIYLDSVDDSLIDKANAEILKGLGSAVSK